MKKVKVDGRLLLRPSLEKTGIFANRPSIGVDIQEPTVLDQCEDPPLARFADGGECVISSHGLTCPAHIHGAMYSWSKPMNAVTITPKQAEQIAKDAEHGCIYFVIAEPSDSSAEEPRNQVEMATVKRN